MHLPGPLRATVGLVASAAAEVKRLPDRAIELPMLAVSTALQASLRAQQRYARLAARGDEVLNRRSPTEAPPPWATFDEPVAVDEARQTVFGRGAENGAGREDAARSMLGNLFGAQDPTVPQDGREPVDEVPTFDEGPPVTVPGRSADTTADVPKPARKAAGKSVPARNSASGARATAKQPAGTKKAGAKKAAKKAGTKQAPAKKAATKPANGAATKSADRAGSKNVSKPRHAAPSAFDNVADIGG